jgi:dipeptidyl-peptidase-4
MNFIKITTFCISLGFVINTANTSITFAQNDTISLEDIWLKGTFAATAVPGFNVLPDGKNYTKTEQNGSVAIYNLKNGSPNGVLLAAKDLLYQGDTIKVAQFSINSDGSKMLLFDQPSPIYRHSTAYKVYVYDVKSKSIETVDTGKILHASFAPDGKKVAYVAANNLFVKDLSTKGINQITKDGKRNQIINGNCDWVYEEEFSFTQAYEWSPNSESIAYYRFDETQVKDFTLFYERGNTYPEPYTFKYPKAGENNSIVSIHIHNLNSNNTITADLGPETDQYIPRIKWTNNPNKLAITRLNRHQNHLELLFADAQSGQSTVVYEEKNKYYIDITDNLYFLPNGNSFVFSSERDGYNHLYRLNWESNELTQLTKGKDEIKDVVAVDLKGNKIFYTTVENVVNTAFYVLDIKKMHTTKLSGAAGTYSINPCQGLSYFVMKYATATTPPVYTLIDAKGKTVRVLEDNKKLKEKMSRYALSSPEFITVPNAAGESLNAYMMKPAHFDGNKRYPVLMYQYSGPGSQRVVNNFTLDNYWWHQFLTQKGYIIVVADGRGTGGRGEEFKKKTYLQLGKLESEDQIAVAKYLGTQSYIDATRIGIWGWSYGGFMSSTCIFKAPEVFKAAIAVAPVTNWRYYDNIYTERFMRTPQENPKGYDDNSPIHMAKNLKGKFFLVHGIADDNVHVQNATELSKTLVDNNKDFDVMYYTNKDHGIHGGYTRYHLYNKMTNFLLNNL